VPAFLNSGQPGTKAASTGAARPETPVNRRSPVRTMRRIMDAAQKEFADKGYDAARMEAIATAAGISKQLVYHYFKTKNELYGVLLDEAAKGLEWLLDNAAYDVLSAPEAMRLLVTRIVDDYLNRPYIARMTLDQSIHRGSHVLPRNQFLPTMHKLIDHTIAPLLRRGAMAGDFRDQVDPKIFFLMMFEITISCFIRAPAMSMISGIDFETPEGVALWRQSTIDFLLYALRPEPDLASRGS
jgi:TetR/AcrR family transcriptional regulator